MSEWRGKDNGCPCYLCHDRKPGTGCHDRCEEYKSWKASQDQLKAEAKKRIGVNSMSDMKRKAIWNKAIKAKRYGHGGTRNKND